MNEQRLNYAAARALLVQQVAKTCPGPHQPDPRCPACGRTELGKKVRR